MPGAPCCRGLRLPPWHVPMLLPRTLARRTYSVPTQSELMWMQHSWFKQPMPCDVAASDHTMLCAGMQVLPSAAQCSSERLVPAMLEMLPVWQFLWHVSRQVSCAAACLCTPALVALHAFTAASHEVWQWQGCMHAAISSLCCADYPYLNWMLAAATAAKASPAIQRAIVETGCTAK